MCSLSKIGHKASFRTEMVFMIESILQNQKHEKNARLSDPGVLRAGAGDFTKHLASSLIKAIVGPRRAGKSTFVFQFLSDRNFAYANFDDEKLIDIDDYDELLKALKSVYGKFDYLFLDEIQNLPKWELFVNRLQRQGYNLVISGSNAQLLSGELATHLTGRYVSCQILPFSFDEYLLAKSFKRHNANTPSSDEGVTIHHLQNYLMTGGYPEVIVRGADRDSYLKTLYESVLFKDIVKRYNVRFPGLLSDLGSFLLTNHARESSLTSLKNSCNAGSVHTVENYTNYLVCAYLVFWVKRFAIKLKLQAKAPKKIYAFDTGMMNATKFNLSPDRGRAIENLVAIELMRRRTEFYSYKTTDQKEVDFVIKEGSRVTQLIQVCYDLSAAKTKKRELTALTKASKDLQCNALSVITWSEEGRDTFAGKKINYVPLWKWLAR